ncbi:MAG: hypothetical protein H7X91_03520 [Burkholderiales bacterium]|nr:hypothetical protein [Burkholderiales bacterium]
MIDAEKFKAKVAAKAASFKVFSPNFKKKAADAAFEFERSAPEGLRCALSYFTLKPVILSTLSVASPNFGIVSSFECWIER